MTGRKTVLFTRGESADPDLGGEGTSMADKRVRRRSLGGSLGGLAGGGGPSVLDPIDVRVNVSKKRMSTSIQMSAGDI